MTDIPLGISLDEKIYQQIIFQLLKNAIKYNHKDSAEGHLIIIDIAYFQLRDTEKPHRFSLVDIPQSNICRLSCSKPLGNADEPVQDLGFLATRIIDHGDGMIDWREFMAALRPDWQDRGPLTDSERIDDEINRQVALCTCKQKFKVFQVGEGKYRVSRSL